MLEREFKSSWLDLTLQYAKVSRPSHAPRPPLTSPHPQEFVTEFFDQNPISQMAIVVTRDGQAERMSPLGGESTPPRASLHQLTHRRTPGNPVDHLKVLQNKKKLEARGDPSLQNVLNMARTGLRSVPSH